MKDIKQRRIEVAVAAYAYECMQHSFISDEDYDKLSRIVHEERLFSTDNDVLDKFFREHFSPDTGMWVRAHPEIVKLDRLCRYLLDNF